MNILITGSKGFIGRNLVQHFSKFKHNIKAIDLEDFYFQNWTENLSVILNIFEPDVIFHIGACSDTLEKDVNYMMEVNYESTKIIVDWAKSKFKKVIYSSSAASYGVNQRYPSNLYGWSKYVGEQYVISNCGVALRYFNVYGPYEENKGKMSSIVYQAWKFKNENKEEFKLFPGKPTRDFVYVKDIISANIYAWENFESVSGKYYEVGYGESRSFEDILSILNITYIYRSEDEIPKGYQFYTCSDKKLWMMGWEPKYNLERGIKDYLNYLNP